MTVGELIVTTPAGVVTLPRARVRPERVRWDREQHRAPYGEDWFTSGTGQRLPREYRVTLEVVNAAGIEHAAGNTRAALEALRAATAVLAHGVSFEAAGVRSESVTPIVGGYRVDVVMLARSTASVEPPAPPAGNPFVAAAQSLGAVVVHNQERDGSGDWVDESGNAFTGAAVNGPTWNASGGPGANVPGYWSFDNASEQHIDVGDDPALRFGEHTLVWWHRNTASDAGQFAPMISKGDTSYQVRLENLNARSLRYDVRNGASQGYAGTGEAGTPLPADEWVMFMARYDGAQVALYRIVSGSASLIDSASYSGGVAANTSKLVYAAQDNAGTLRRWWTGDLAGVALFDSALTVSEFESLHAASAG